MDAAYVKFVMCQCLINRADWGLAIGCMNVVYSFFLLQFWVVELIKFPDHYPVKWVLLYGFNVVFNVITMMRIVKRESSSVFYWMCETAALLIFRVHHIYYHPDEFWLAKSELYRVTNIIIDVYIGLSMLGMFYIICGLRLQPDRTFSEEEMVNDCKFDPEAAKKAEQTDKEESCEGESERGQLAKQKELEMKELNRKAILKLADLEDGRTHCSQELAPPFEPTAPEEESLSSGIIFIHETPEPSAPPESQLCLDEDFFCEIDDIGAPGDAPNDISFNE
ncbi:uncharacterized protein [Drosophila suzukii]|uniref:Uncharacterized protein n=1 Tax=Drosophila suzukii TaxID=28584 RepID=A0AB39ZPA9_DROSZ